MCSSHFESSSLLDIFVTARKNFESQVCFCGSLLFSMNKSVDETLFIYLLLFVVTMVTVTVGKIGRKKMLSQVQKTYPCLQHRHKMCKSGNKYLSCQNYYSLRSASAHDLFQSVTISSITFTSSNGQ